MVHSLALAQGDPEPSITVIRDLTDTEYADATEANACLYRWYRDDSLLVMAQLNYRSYREYLTYLAGKLRKAGASEDAILESAVRGVNLRALNLLSSVRTFLDHTETQYRRRYGNASPELRHFKGVCSRAYSGSFSYRFTYKLRNYAQHCGLPIQQVSFESRLTNRTSGVITHSFKVLCARDHLLADFSGWGQVESELRAMPERIEIGEHLDGMMSEVQGIYRASGQPRAAELQRAVETLSELLRGMDLTAAHPCLVGGLEGYSESEPWNLSLSWFHLDLLEAARQIA